MASVKRGRNSMQKANPFCTTVPLDRQTTATLTPSSDGSDQVDASADEMKRSLKDGVSSMALEMLTGEKQAVPAGILLPTQPFVLWWEGVSALLLVYTALVLPVRLANFALIEDSVGWNWSDPWTFLGSPALEYRTPPLCVSQHVALSPHAAPPPPIAADLLVDIFFLLDILRNFRQSSYSAEGKLVYSPWEIAKGYLQTWFLLDLAASFPIDWIMNTIGKQSDAANGAVLLRMLKLGKLLRLVRIIRMGRSEAMEEEDDDNEGGGRVQRRGVVAVAKEEFAKLDLGPLKQALIWLLAGHILGCIQFIVFVQLRGTIEGTYIERAGYDTDAGGVELYLASVCHAILQLTVISAGLESPRARSAATPDLSSTSQTSPP